MERYRILDGEKVMEYSEKHGAYLFLGDLMGRTLEQFLMDLDWRHDNQDLDDAMEAEGLK